MKHSRLISIFAGSLLLLGGCSSASESVSDNPTPTHSIVEEEFQDDEGKLISSDPYMFNLPSEYVSPEYSPDSSGRYTDRWDLKDEEGHTVARVSIAPFVAETAHVDNAKKTLQSKFLFSIGNNFSMGDEEKIEIAGSDESYFSSFDYVGEDSLEYGGCWWITWNQEFNRFSVVEFQYEMQHKSEAQETIDMITDTLEVYPDTYTKEGPGNKF